MYIQDYGLNIVITNAKNISRTYAYPLAPKQIDWITDDPLFEICFHGKTLADAIIHEDIEGMATLILDCYADDHVLEQAHESPSVESLDKDAFVALILNWTASKTKDPKLKAQLESWAKACT
jgi:hypothetical protein